MNLQHSRYSVAAQLRRRLTKWRPGMTIWLDRPCNLYQTDAQVDAYLRLMHQDDYTAPFHDPLLRLIEAKAKRLFSPRIKKCALIDFGPGFPDKTFPIIRAINAMGAHLTYIPVDISTKFLSLAREAVQERFSVPVLPVHALFEDAPSLARRAMLGSLRAYRIALIGLTFMNYRPRVILRILRSAVRTRGVVLVATELLGTLNQDLAAPYHNEDVETMNRAAVRSIGVVPGNSTFFARFVRSRIEMGFQLTRPLSTDSGHLLPSGTQIITAISCRYTPNQFLEILGRDLANPRMLISSDGRVALGIGEHKGDH